MKLCVVLFAFFACAVAQYGGYGGHGQEEHGHNYGHQEYGHHNVIQHEYGHQNQGHGHGHEIQSYGHNDYGHQSYGHQSYGHQNHGHQSYEHHGHGTSYAQINQVAKHEKEIHIKAHPHYKYDFGVHDSHTHDIKEKHETRDGDHVKGSYSFLQPDHLIRRVDYESDHKNGWRAQVSYHKHH